MPITPVQEPEEGFTTPPTTPKFRDIVCHDGPMDGFTPTADSSAAQSAQSTPDRAAAREAARARAEINQAAVVQASAVQQEDSFSFRYIFQQVDENLRATPFIENQADIVAQARPGPSVTGTAFASIATPITPAPQQPRRGVAYSDGIARGSVGEVWSVAAVPNMPNSRSNSDNFSRGGYWGEALVNAAGNVITGPRR